MFQEPDRPTWINGTSSDYPVVEQYLLAVGEGSSSSLAEERAYAGIAKIFKAEIKAETRDWEIYWIHQQGDQERSGRELSLEHLTKVSTDRVLENIRILDRWADLQRGTYYALAGIDRSQGEQILLSRISQYDGQIHQDVQRAHETSDILERVALLRRGMKTLIIREAANTDLQIIRESGKGVPASYQVKPIGDELMRVMAEHIVILVEVQGQQSSEVRVAIVEGLRRQGFQVVGDPRGVSQAAAMTSRADQAVVELHVKGHVRLWEVDLPDPLFSYVRWCGEFRVMEKVSQRVIGVAADSGKEGHATKKAAWGRASRSMQKSLASKIPASLSTYIFGEGEGLTLESAVACQE